MTILVDHQLKELGADGALDPFDPSMVRPASIDIRLGNTFRVARNHKILTVDLAEVPSVDEISELVTVPYYLDPQRPMMRNQAGKFVIHPNEFVLASSLEIISVPADCAMYLDGRSSLGRLGLAIHVTAGYFDPGFTGRGTFELVNLSRVPIVLRPGLSICQTRWQRLDAIPDRDYSKQYDGRPGRYQGDLEAMGSRFGG